ncbi:MAG TPA: thioredoxin-disulfide reductase [Anaerolineaceae bacterium]|nr:thioredoxin-disulfide reductase [Anaerolineaceae bacterium]
MEFKLTNLGSVSSSNETEKVSILILGSGPAGLAAALYAARAELSPVVLTGLELGGQAALTHAIENYPGFPEGIGGAQLGELFQKQAERFGARVDFDTANTVDLAHHPFRVDADNKTYLADAIIIGTGASPNHLNIPGEKELTGKGVSYCATCDGWFFKDKPVVVVGGGDSALEEALFLTRYASSVTIIHRRDALRAGAILQRRAIENQKIKFIWNSVLTEVVGKSAVEAVRLRNVQDGEETLLPTQGVFIFIGHKPNTQLFHGQVEMDELGYIVTNHLMETNILGVYAAGEAADQHFRQVITSAGMGAAAAIRATHFLEENK